MEPQDRPAAGREIEPAPTRKAYEKPQLQVYGDLTEITQERRRLENV